MEIIKYIGYWIGFPVLIGFVLFGIYAMLLHDSVSKDTDEKFDSNLLDHMLATIIFPELNIWRLSVNNESKFKILVSSLLFFLTIGFILVANYTSGWNWSLPLKQILITILAFGVVQRGWAVYQVYRLLKVRKKVEDIEQEIADAEEKMGDLTNDIKKEKKEAANLEKEIQSVSMRNKQIYAFSNKIHTELVDHLESYKEILRTVSSNINRLRNWDDKNVRIAIDTNILMECDDYLIEELKRHKLLISKTVQGEWDYNIKGNDPEKKSKGLRARDRLDELVENGKQTSKPCDFIVKKWNSQFMKDNNLRTDENDEKIIADYLYEYQKDEDIVILSADKMFTISASIHMPVIRMEKVNLFGKEAELV
ncbi:PIN domain-containing protein [Gracilibacillus xinjiangensis]|uniref:PIN domain-containing protein n=1 Tax=Gracilibacillus xinjiangensis TaxID=1193282 RepID=A0ABV8WVC1_9BACI